VQHLCVTPGRANGMKKPLTLANQRLFAFLVVMGRNRDLNNLTFVFNNLRLNFWW
jgi:hypothetical protein